MRSYANHWDAAVRANAEPPLRNVIKLCALGGASVPEKAAKLVHVGGVYIKIQPNEKVEVELFMFVAPGVITTPLPFPHN